MHVVTNYFTFSEIPGNVLTSKSVFIIGVKHAVQESIRVVDAGASRVCRALTSFYFIHNVTYISDLIFLCCMDISKTLILNNIFFLISSY